MSRFRDMFAMKDYFTDGPFKAQIQKSFKDELSIHTTITWTDELAQKIKVRISINPARDHGSSLVFEIEYYKRGPEYIADDTLIKYQGVRAHSSSRASIEGDVVLGNVLPDLARPLIKRQLDADMRHLRGSFAPHPNNASEKISHDDLARKIKKLEWFARFMKNGPKTVTESVGDNRTFGSRAEVNTFFKQVLEPYFHEHIKGSDVKLRFQYSPPSEPTAIAVIELFVNTIRNSTVQLVVDFTNKDGLWILSKRADFFSSGFSASTTRPLPVTLDGSGNLEEAIFSKFKSESLVLVNESVVMIKKKWQQDQKLPNILRTSEVYVQTLLTDIRKIKTAFGSTPKTIKESIQNILKEDEAKTLYVSRPLKNADELIEWAKAQGFKKTLPAEDMHVTVVYSKKKMDWFSVPDGVDHYRNKYQKGDRSVEALGEAVVLKFESPDLSARWQEFRDAGASWDYPSYMPHVSITYDPGDVDLDTIEPFTGLLEFGPEEFTEVQTGWADDIEEVSESYDDDYQGGYDDAETEKWIRSSIGYWITAQGAILPCNYDTDDEMDNEHHNIVANNYLNRDDDDGMEIAYEAGWIRVRINDGQFNIEYYSDRVAKKAYRVLLKKIDEFDGAFRLEDYDGARDLYTDKRMLKVAMTRLNNTEEMRKRQANV